MPVDPYLGEVTMFAGNFAPRGWAFCDGQLLAISSNTALFSILGTVYGGDGRTSFGLPDLRSRFPIGPGNGPGLSTYRAGEKGGSETETLTINQMPNHGHSPRLHGEQANGDKASPNQRMLAGTSALIYADVNPNDNIPFAAESVTETNIGGSQAFDKMNPYLSIHFIIALQGVFPSRS